MPPFGHAAGYTLVATIHHTEIHMRRFAGMGTRSMMLVAILAAAAPSLVEAQYFGRNKVQYQTFDFRVASTEHYDLHFWIWQPNPDGMFAAWNPSVSCAH